MHHMAPSVTNLDEGKASRTVIRVPDALWRVAGWLTGALPALFGRAAVLRTIDAVETFVEGHY
jgi:demethoxyubiquinone hydroxylase (CLK1/Coq7/Cat5 family)